MADFFTGKALDEKLTDIIWKANKELIILSPFIRLDEYCKKIFSKLKNSPELEIIIVFGKNEGETQRSLNQDDLEFFKDFENIVIIYCNNLHAKYYSNENEALLTSLNLLGKSMTGNVEYGISFPNSKLTIDKLYTDSMNSTNEVIKSNPCVFVKRPLYKKTNLGLSKKHLGHVILFDQTNALYRNRSFEQKFYNDFEYELFQTDVKPTREEFQTVNEPKTRNQNYNRNNNQELGYCIRTGVRIPFDPSRPFSYEAYQSWVIFENWDYPEKYCHKTGKYSNGRTSMANPIL
ncbi:MAG TPA: hypothetical protein PKN96_03085 [Flavobacterium sp.]|uniref:hypothetical protein n=1 Tax=Flavobacterium sp. TaxID=239 RepID=UPI002CC4386D|nr:hypothetical protein [Flavobacterium sp.]HNP32256.1 hypothetical protein [Flavobacterium sp.]